MDIPFSVKAFFEVFRTYNQAIWPAQIVAYLLGVAGVVAAIRPRAWTGRAIGGMLGALWIWMGAVYHIGFFSAINPLAYVFGAFFLLQGLLFVWKGALSPSLSFSPRWDLYGWTGGLFLAYAMIVYPVLGSIAGHTYPASPVFGVAPCPTTIFTFGLLLWTRGRVPGWLLLIPVTWSVIGVSAALQLGVLEDLGLVVAGLAGTVLLLYRNRHGQAVTTGPSPA